MKIQDILLATVMYLDTFEFPEEVWLEFKDTVRDEDDFPEHDEDIRSEYAEDFYEWLRQNHDSDPRITQTSTNKILNGEPQSIEWKL